MVDEKIQVENVEHVVYDSPEKEIVEFRGSDALLEAAQKDPPKIFSKRMLQLYIICLIPFLCSTMNGYDGSLLSSLLLLKPFNDTFGATTVGIKAGLISAMYQIGGVATIPFLGPVNDTFGRRFGMFFGCLIVVIGTVVQATSKNINQLMGGRFVLGFGVSFATAAAPIYAIEISHPSYRAAITGSYNTLYCWGSILATVVLFCTQNIPNNRAWIIPTYVQMVCPGLVVIFSMFLPESPRWLYCNGKQEKAKEILTYYHGEGNPENAFITLQIREFEEQLELDGTDKRWWDYRALFRDRASIYRLCCNLVYSCFGQLSNGGISYFVGAFYHSAGITSNRTIFSYNLGTGFLSFILALIGAQVIQQIGRRKVILGSLVGMTLFWALVTICVARFDASGEKTTAWAQAGIAFYILFGVVYGKLRCCLFRQVYILTKTQPSRLLLCKHFILMKSFHTK
ncbi:hexose transporter HXT13 [Sugiyamaella lignohabitans]|uniref:Hexose transporter HXT13 n=1 Tax=Sugiyamaella lignohabitans TaxID=796027 RepID=A0A161HLV1_9ASCO|nr:hexose transporter HXT13 [Sugiyamaella lignohabitans]ANB14457.1 hexose transporter HXT13 [Sugiyamaella lignohabitans]